MARRAQSDGALKWGVGNGTGGEERGLNVTSTLSSSEFSSVIYLFSFHLLPGPISKAQKSGT